MIVDPGKVADAQAVAMAKAIRDEISKRLSFRDK